MLKWMTTDRYVCEECGDTALVLSRWLEGPVNPKCRACGSLLMRRRQGVARNIRDVFILTNAA